MYCHCLSQKIQFQIYCCVSQQFFYYAHKFILLEILPLILEVIYTAVSLLPLMQYDVICDVLLQTLVGWPFFILKDHFFKHHPHFDVCEMNATVLVTDRPMFKPQQPHTDYSWETILPNRRIDDLCEVWSQNASMVQQMWIILVKWYEDLGKWELKLDT